MEKLRRNTLLSSALKTVVVCASETLVQPTNPQDVITQKTTINKLYRCVNHFSYFMMLYQLLRLYSLKVATMIEIRLFRNFKPEYGLSRIKSVPQRKQHNTSPLKRSSG